DAKLRPFQIEGVNGESEFVVSVSGGNSSHACLALTSEGKVYAWGLGPSLSPGTTKHRGPSLPSPLAFAPNEVVVQLCCSSDAAALVTVSGQLWTWGDGSHGKLGHGDTSSQQHPKKVEAFGHNT
ncbi:unnamed protein product, partial [Chrysoparadoxa australica]